MAFVAIKEFRHGIVGDKEIDMAVTGVIRNSYAQAFARLCQAKLFRNFGEVTVAIIVVNQGGNRLEIVGMTVRAITFLTFAAPDVVKVPRQIPQDNEVEQTIAIQVHPCGAGGPASTAYARFFRNIGKGAITIVVIELVAPVRRHI